MATEKYFGFEIPPLNIHLDCDGDEQTLEDCDLETDYFIESPSCFYEQYPTWIDCQPHLSDDKPDGIY